MYVEERTYKHTIFSFAQVVMTTARYRIVLYGVTERSIGLTRQEVSFFFFWWDFHFLMDDVKVRMFHPAFQSRCQSYVFLNICDSVVYDSRVLGFGNVGLFFPLLWMTFD